ncbi:uncharacterized protein LOC144521392 [Sander vitreus]
MERHREHTEETKLRGEVLPQDVLEVIVGEEEQQECSSSVDQQEPEPPPHIKEEQEELWSSQEGEQLPGLEEDDITKFPFTPVPVKSEDDEEEVQSSQFHQRQTQHMETEDVQQLLVIKEEVPPEQQECSSTVDQEEPEPPPHIKEELWSSQEGEQLPGLEEDDITKFPFTPIIVKSEDDEEEAQSSQLHQRLNTWKQKLMERTVEDQNQPGTHIHILFYNQRLKTRLETLLNLRLMTVLIGRRPENLSQL